MTKILLIIWWLPALIAMWRFYNGILQEIYNETKVNIFHMSISIIISFHIRYLFLILPVFLIGGIIAAISCEKCNPANRWLFNPKEEQE